MEPTHQGRKQPARTCAKRAHEQSSLEMQSSSSTATATKKQPRVEEHFTWERALREIGVAPHDIENAREFFAHVNIEEDPPVIFMWRGGDRLLTAMRDFHQLNPNVNLPAYMNINLQSPHTTIDDVHAALLNECCVGLPDGLPIIRYGVVVQCTLGNCAALIGHCDRMCFEPYLRDIAAFRPAAFPLAEILVPKPNSRVNGDCTRVTPPRPFPPGVHLWGS